MPSLVEGGWVQRVPVGEDKFVLFYEDGSVRFEHLCDRLRDEYVLRVAPRLQIGNGHRIVRQDPLTIVASLLCEDCGLHGFVTEGIWRGV